MPKDIRQEAADRKARTVAPPIKGRKSKKARKMNLSLRYDPTAVPKQNRHNLVVSLIGQWFRDSKAKKHEEDAKSKGTTDLGAKNKTLEQLEKDLAEAIEITNDEKERKLKLLFYRHGELAEELRGISGDTERKTKIDTERSALIVAMDSVRGAAQDTIKALERTHEEQKLERREKMKALKARQHTNSLISAERKRRKAEERMSSQNEKDSAVDKMSSPLSMCPPAVQQLQEQPASGVCFNSVSSSVTSPPSGLSPAAEPQNRAGAVSDSPAEQMPQNRAMEAFDSLDGEFM